MWTAFSDIADSRSLEPHGVPVPVLPGPSPTTTTSAPTTWWAARRPVNTLTASRSPPKAWPTVITASRRFDARSEADSLDIAAGRAAPSVIT
jgi:hypothetical protein